MTFDPTHLTNEHLNELAQLLHTTGMDRIPFTSSEIKTIFEFDDPAKELRDFTWNLTGGFISGTASEKLRVISPEFLLSEPLPDNGWFEYAVTANILNFIRNRIGDVSLLNKLQVTFDEEFEYLSQGQAKSVIKRYLGLTLSSTERNDIYRLRKKIEGYWKLINAFEDKLAVNRSRPDRYIDRPPHEPLLTTDELVQETLSKLAFFCFECKYVEPFPQGSIIDPPSHHGKPMSLNWNVRSSPTEITNSYRELEQAISDISATLTPVRGKSTPPSSPPEGFPKLYCSVCSMYQPIDEELQQRLDHADHRISLPTHHNQEMEIVTRPVEDLAKMRQIMEKFDLVDPDKQPGFYFVCTTCFLMVKTETGDDGTDVGDPPQHHGQKMKPLWIKDSNK